MWHCRRSSEGTCMFHSGSSSFLKLPSALINGDIVGISGQEKKKAQFEKKGRGVNLLAFRQMQS